jgi:hypothetical protein
MSNNTILGWFSKSGPYSHLSRRLHNLPRPQLEYALYLIARGTEPADAIKRAKVTKAHPFRNEAGELEPMEVNQDGFLN